MDKKPKRKKLNKRAREAKRIELADLYNSAFKHGYSVGYEQAVRDKKEESTDAIIQMVERHFGVIPGDKIEWVKKNVESNEGVRYSWF